MANDPYFTAATAKAADDRLADVADATIVRFVAEFEPIAERYLGCALTPRTGATFTGWTDRCGVLELPHVQVTACTLVDADSSAVVTVDHIDQRIGRVHANAVGRLTATYSHGLAAVPVGVQEACLEYVVRRSQNNGQSQSRDVLSQAYEGATTRYSTPDWSAGRPTGYLQVDSLLNSERNYRISVF